MPPIRNSRVAGGLYNSAPNTAVIYTVPANTVLLLKTVHLYSGLATPSTAAAVYLSGPNSLQAILTLPQFDPHGGITWQGWTALNAGDAVEMSCAIAIFYWLSGALLPFVPGF